MPSFRPEQFGGLFSEVIVFEGTLSGALTAAAAAETSATVAVAGVVQGDVVLCFAIDEDTESGSLTAHVNASDLVEFTLVNATGSTITIGAVTARGVVVRLCAAGLCRTRVHDHLVRPG